MPARLEAPLDPTDRERPEAPLGPTDRERPEAPLGPTDRERPEAPQGPTDRERGWAATMQGSSVGGFEVAHRDSRARIEPGPVLSRRDREDLEAAGLRPGATLSGGAGRRAVAEEPDPNRTCFERDRDRILHAAAFRRLAGKTQVFVFPEDHQRTRLTHALEVAQVARSVARALRLNVALTEAIALGHDCGHGPGGHASEDALSPFLDDGFDHAVWGADVTMTPLNLCAETLDGIRNHSWSRPAPSTPEGEVVSWADRIAYVCHDFEDAVEAQVVRTDQLPERVAELCGRSRRTQLAAFVNAMISAAERTGLIGMADEPAAALADFRAFNYERIYLRPSSRLQASYVIDMLRALVDHICARPDRLPDDRRERADDGEGIRWAAVEWVAGMTDRYAVRSARQWLDYDPARLPRGVDLDT